MASHNLIAVLLSAICCVLIWIAVSPREVVVLDPRTELEIAIDNLRESMERIGR